ncbi:hypothetical protein D3C71_1662680 [compost metagenome]
MPGPSHRQESASPARWQAGHRTGTRHRGSPARRAGAGLFSITRVSWGVPRQALILRFGCLGQKRIVRLNTIPEWNCDHGIQTAAQLYRSGPPRRFYPGGADPAHQPVGGEQTGGPAGARCGPAAAGAPGLTAAPDRCRAHRAGAWRSLAAPTSGAAQRTGRPQPDGPR